VYESVDAFTAVVRKTKERTKRTKNKSLVYESENVAFSDVVRKWEEKEKGKELVV
jgi:cation transport regulator ChaB